MATSLLPGLHLSHTHTLTMQALPFPKAVVSQLDYNSRLRLALCFFRLKSLVETSTKQQTIKLEPDMTDLKSRLKLKDQKSMQMVKQESKPSRSMPGMLQDMMNEVLLPHDRLFWVANSAFQFVCNKVYQVY